MIHVRIDDNEKNADAIFQCGIPWPLPEGHKYVFEAEGGLWHLVSCEGCGGVPGGRKLGTPISELSGQPGQPGYERFKAIAASWGYD